LDRKDITIVKNFKNLLSREIKVHEVRVFGSRARGTATEESDLDVLVVVEHIDRWVEKYVSECAWEAGFPENVVIVPITVSLDTLQNSPIRESVFIHNVYSEGVCV